MVDEPGLLPGVEVGVGLNAVESVTDRREQTIRHVAQLPQDTAFFQFSGPVALGDARETQTRYVVRVIRIVNSQAAFG